jgi:hypothetical protein
MNDTLPKMTHRPASVKSIRFPFSESAHIDEKLVFQTFEAAANYLGHAAHHAPADGCYDKTDFEVTFEDGEVYKGRVDITHEMVGGCDLLGHMRRHCGFHGGRFVPAHMTTASYRACLAAFGEDTRQACSDFLDKYLGGMEEQAINEADHNAEAERIQRASRERLAENMRRTMPPDAHNID